MAAQTLTRCSPTPGLPVAGQRTAAANLGRHESSRAWSRVAMRLGERGHAGACADAVTRTNVEPDMDEGIDTARVDDAVLALLYLTLHDIDPLAKTARAWKSFDRVPRLLEAAASLAKARRTSGQCLKPARPRELEVSRRQARAATGARRGERSR
jgi:hypothetical protein